MAEYYITTTDSLKKIQYELERYGSVEVNKLANNKYKIKYNDKRDFDDAKCAQIYKFVKHNKPKKFIPKKIIPMSEITINITGNPKVVNIKAASGKIININFVS